ncbi:MAG: beta-lactamase family protein [Clostridia bacterium]|nr:beta-lactamase family protein [Clostridia bacterium]
MAFEKLHELLAKYIPGDVVPGCDILVYHHGKLVHREQLGYQDYLRQVPMGTEVYYPVYSCSKVVTCAAVLHLYEEGLIGLDDPLAKYIPAFGKVRLTDGSVPKNPITLRHCFTMSSGLDYSLEEPHLLEAIRRNPHATTVELAEAIAERPLLVEPGTHYHYSLSHDVLAAVAEVVTGKSFEEYLTEWCFKPLGLKNISYNFNEENRTNLVAQFTNKTGKLQAVGGKCAYIFTDCYYSGGAGIITTAEDYSKILCALSMGTAGGLLKTETLDLMRENQLDEQRLSDLHGNDYIMPYGYGLGVRTMMEPEKYGLDPRIREFGWSGAAGSHSMIDTEHQIAVFYAQCVLGSAPDPNHLIRAGIRDAVYEELLK